MPPVLAGLIVFAASAAVLVLEILAGRLLAPYVGVTLETYTGIIGVVLAGIAVGSWYGGRLADRLNPRAMLGPTHVLGGVLALLILPLVTFFGATLRGGGPVAIVVLSTVGFFAPAAVLSAVTPTVIKIQLGDLDHTGQVVGRLSALATAGAIFGTFLTGFVLVARFPSRAIVLGLGVLLLLAGGALWWWLHPREQGRPAVVALLALLAVGLTGATPVPCDYETAYYCAEVIEDPDNPSGRLLRLDSLKHSYVDLADEAHLEFGYLRVLGDVLTVAAPPGEPLEALHIGGGAMSLPRYLAATRPGSHSTVLEIDPQLVEIAEEEFGFEPTDAIEVRTGDARMALEDGVGSGYDVVVGDAFGGLAVPWHLTTLEMVELIREASAEDAIYMLNLIDRPPLGFARAKAATLAAGFAHVAVVAEPDRLAGDEGGNFVLLASDAPLPLDGLRAQIAERGGDQAVIAGEEVEAFVGDAPVLTDDYAPVDQLITPYTG
jgi:predicted membrane-bound spermidine synthase